jgi:hypothetical protein
VRAKSVSPQCAGRLRAQWVYRNLNLGRATRGTSSSPPTLPSAVTESRILEEPTLETKGTLGKRVGILTFSHMGIQ